MKKEYIYYYLGTWNVDKNGKRILSVYRTDSSIPGSIGGRYVDNEQYNNREHYITSTSLLKYECINENILLYFIEEARKKLGNVLTPNMITSFVKRTVDDMDLEIPNIKFETIWTS